MDRVSTYPFAVFGGTWVDRVPTHLEQLPRKGKTIVGNDAWFGRECLILPSVHIGDGAIIAAYLVVAWDVEPYIIVGGNPVKSIRKRFDDDLIHLLLAFRW